MAEWQAGQWLIELGIRIWQHSAVAGAFFAGLSCAILLRLQANRMIAEAKRQQLADLREMKEQLLIELQIKQLNGHAPDGDESGLGSV